MSRKHRARMGKPPKHRKSGHPGPPAASSQRSSLQHSVAPFAGPLVRRALFTYGMMALAAAAAIKITTMLPMGICWLLGVNVTALIAWSFDKSAARRREVRVPELVLFLLAGLGASPAALVARYLFRHKLLDPKFNGVLYRIAAAHVALAIGATVYAFVR